MFSKKDIIVLGMMIFALFLGAGNIIFPPMEGYSAGNHWATASLGFVITGVLMPFITLVVVSVLICDNRRTHAIYYISCCVSIRTW